MVQSSKIQLPKSAKLYHGVYPGIKDGIGDDITVKSFIDYLLAVRKKAAFIYFSNEWCRCRDFPARTATWVASAGAVPFIRLMLRSGYKRATEVPENIYTLLNILKGDFDADLQKWASQARAFAGPLLVEYGTECNGNWFPWNAQHNGKDAKTLCPDNVQRNGAEQFQAVFRRIVAIMKEEGADNITWVFHVNAGDDPKESWNDLKAYFPGPDVVDWLAVSVYGAQKPIDDPTDPPQEFFPQMDSVYGKLAAKAADKPWLVAEFGCTAGHPKMSATDWATKALADIMNRGNGRWSNLIGFSWWNDAWTNDPGQADTEMRVQEIHCMPAVFQQGLVGTMIQEAPST